MRRSAPAIPVLLILACGAEPVAPGPPPAPSDLEVVYSGDAPAGREGEQSSGPHLEPACRITALWSRCPDEDFLMYVLYRSESPGVSEGGPGVTGIASVACADTLLYVDEDVDWDGTYHYALLTLDMEGLGAWSNEDSATTPDILPTASTLRLDSLYLNWAALSWTPCPDGDFVSYRIYRSDDPGIGEDPDAAILRAIFDEPTDTILVDTTIVFTPMYYAVRTENDFGAVVWSNELRVEYEPPTFPWRIIRSLSWEGDIVSVAMTWDGSAVFVANESFFEIARGAMPPLSLTSGSTSPRPVSLCLSPDGTRLFVACDLAGTVETYGANSLILWDSIPLGGSPSCIAGAPQGEHVYCGCLQSGKVYAIHAEEVEVTAEASPGDGPAGIACRPSGDRLFVSCRYGDRVAAYSCPDLEPLFSVNVGDGPGPISVSWDGTRVYVGCEADGSVWVLSANDGHVIHVLDPVGKPAGLAETPDGRMLYVSDAESGRILVYEIEGWKQVLEIDIGAGAGELRCSPDGAWLIAGGGGGSSLLVIGP